MKPILYLLAIIITGLQITLFILKVSLDTKTEEYAQVTDELKYYKNSTSQMRTEYYTLSALTTIDEEARKEGYIDATDFIVIQKQGISLYHLKPQE